MKPKLHILPTIIVSQFACTSLWFAGNAIVDDLTSKTGLGTEIIGYVLSSVQLGFIVGTLVFALLMIADRFSPSKVFMICAFLGALCNLVLLYEDISVSVLLIIRFGTGFFLAGIYPVGMKIAADYYEKGLGKALGYLVGALVLGTAFPYLISGLDFDDYSAVVFTTSIFATFGGLAMWFLVPNGPYRKASTQLQLKTGFALFKNQDFKKAAFGYFGHMWELYAFWAITPLAITGYNALYNASLSIPLWTCSIISVGALSCIIGGYISLNIGSKKVALFALTISALLCLLSPLFFELPAFLFLIVWCLWGMVVIADSPQFSTMVAATAPTEIKGTALTLVNCIGFAISIISIQLLLYLLEYIDIRFIFMLLALGPIVSLLYFRKKSS